MAIGLVLGGGAPNLTLMSGALLALDEAGIDFKVITTTGAGMVVGLLYSAPRRMDPDLDWIATRRQAVGGTREWGIDDAIYDRFPVNYKIFQKSGRMAEAWSRMMNPPIWAIPRDSRRRRLLADTMAFWSAAMSPTDLSPDSKGLCQPAPWIEMLVDFDELERNLGPTDTRFRLSAYCIEDEDDRTFHREEITADHFKAALAMPFIYAPYKLGGKTYLEGSAFKTIELNPEHVMSEAEIDTIVFMDLMGNRHLIGEPRWLIDAWGKSIIAPLTRLAEQDLKIFKLRRDLHRIGRELDTIRETIGRGIQTDEAEREIAYVLNELQGMAHSEDHHFACEDHMERTELLRMPFKCVVPREHWPVALDWSHSNMSALFDYGYRTGEVFLEEHGDRLRQSMRHTAPETSPPPRARPKRPRIPGSGQAAQANG